MASGRPRQPNDPSIMASVEAALSTVARPNLIAGLWHWRYELGLIAGGLLGAITIGYTLGLDWLIAVAGDDDGHPDHRDGVATFPPGHHRQGLVRHHAAPGQDRLQARLDPDQGRPTPGSALHRTRRARRAGLAVVPRRDNYQGPASGQGRPAGRLLGQRRPSRDKRPPQPHRRARGDTPSSGRAARRSHAGPRLAVPGPRRGQRQRP